MTIAHETVQQNASDGYFRVLAKEELEVTESRYLAKVSGIFLSTLERMHASITSKRIKVAG